jgi:hypothetical protein
VAPASEPQNFAHGLKSDPLVAFAIVFSALIHDVGHQGISNVRLAKEEPSLGEQYHNQSVAEQNSIDVAWEIFMSSRFDKLRQYIFISRAEMMRFRQLVVNAVIATDIFGKEQNKFRKDRWEKAFDWAGKLSDSEINDMRATVVMELILQASNVGHTMQLFQEYRKWNHKLFSELNKAFRAGRMGADPKSFWYKGELAFFDFYIVPLLGKLKECNVFGARGEEYLATALRNRAEWEAQGEHIVQAMIKASGEIV